MARVGKRQRRERLLKLATYLVNLPENREFDMSHWAAHEGAHKPAERNYCGTSACALGHAAMIPAFKREGLRLEWKSGQNNWDDTLQWAAKVQFGKREGVEAGAAFFGLTQDESYQLFSGGITQRSEVIAALVAIANDEDGSGDSCY